MYDPAGSNADQLEKTCDIARERLALMEGQRAELDIAITDLKAQLAEGERLLADCRRQAAE